MSLEACLERLAAAIEAARVLGLPVSDAEAVHREAVERLGFPADVYVLALVGGTGVGKSSLLNALAGGDVSPASVRRPTTDQPVAWVPAAARAELGPLLTWLDVRQVREHADAALGRVAVLDLPDMDSIEPAHRQRVEELLPRVDAVAWVTDPEKYHDAVLHDEFLRRWLPRLERQLLVVNKSDRLARPTRSDCGATWRGTWRRRRGGRSDLGAGRSGRARTSCGAGSRPGSRRRASSGRGSRPRRGRRSPTWPRRPACRPTRTWCPWSRADARRQTLDRTRPRSCARSICRAWSDRPSPPRRRGHARVGPARSAWCWGCSTGARAARRASPIRPASS